MDSMDIRLQQAIAAARAGKRDEARVLLDRFLVDQPEDAHGIFLRSTLATSKEERIENLQQVLEIDPDHRGAKLMLERLGEPETPAEPTAEDFEPEVPQAVSEEPADEAVVTMIQPFEEAEDLPVYQDEEVEAEPFGDIEATAVVMFADEMEEAGIEEAALEAEEEEVAPALDETMIALPGEQEWEEEELPVHAADEEYSKPVEDEDFPPLPEEEEIPEWLTDEAAFKAEAALAAEAAEEEEMPLEMGELPDWLQEEPTEDWLSQEQIETKEGFETIPDDWLEEAEPMELPDEDFYVQPDEYVKPKKRRRVPKRAIEIIFGFLIVLAVLVMIGLVYVFLTY